MQFLLTHFGEDPRHLKRPRGVHVGSDDGDAGVGLFGVAECEGPLKVHLWGTAGGRMGFGRVMFECVSSAFQHML